MAFINQKTWNLISILFGCGYLIFISFPIVDISQHAFLLGFYKAIPIWMCSLLSMAGNDSMVGVALIFGSSGDIMLDVREAQTFENDKHLKQHLFKLGAVLFLIQHLLIIYQFTTYWKSFKSYSLLSFFLVFNAVYFIVLPNISQQLTNIVCVYSVALAITCFLSINALSPNKALKHERFNFYATILFLFSDSLVILHEIDVERATDNYIISMFNEINPILMQNIIMITYYWAQMMFANGAYNRYRYNRFFDET
eukprot:UN03877